MGHPALGSKLASCLGQVPRLDVEVSVHPITRGLLQLRVSLWAGFEWSARVHGASEPWHVWVEDAEQERLKPKNQFFFSLFSLDTRRWQRGGCAF